METSVTATTTELIETGEHNVRGGKHERRAELLAVFRSSLGSVAMGAPLTGQ